MPVYNAERYVAAAVQSILDQTFRDFEFLIIDDGSTDGSLAILEQFAKADQRIRLVSRPNTGYVVALNEMLELARGEFIARMDADDISEKDRFSEQVRCLHSDPALVACGTNVLLIDSEGEPLMELQRPETHERIDCWHLNDTGSAAIAHPAVLLRRRSVEIVGGYREQFCPAEDVDLFLRLAEIGRLMNIQKPLLRYRVHTQSVGHSRRQVQLAAFARAGREALARRGRPAGAQAAEFQFERDDPTTLHLRWAWWAHKGGNYATCRKHARRAIMLAPWRLEAWRAFACGVRGR